MIWKGFTACQHARTAQADMSRYFSLMHKAPPSLNMHDTDCLMGEKSDIQDTQSGEPLRRYTHFTG